MSGTAGTVDGLSYWIAIDLVWNVGAGIAVGVALGFAMARVNARLPPHWRLSASNSGIVSVGLAFLAYGVADDINANGFVAVFCEAVALRNFTKGFDYSRRLDHAAGQFERVAMALVLALLGVSLVRGLFDDLDWRSTAFAAVTLFAVRPLTVLIGFIGSPEDRWTRAALGYFGIRGIASLYYAADLAPRLSGPQAHQLNAVISLVIIASVVFYGMTAHVVASTLTGGKNEFEE
jgi:NhaP-type Na+/H+ or K+/H+ antiporter